MRLTRTAIIGDSLAAMASAFFVQQNHTKLSKSSSPTYLSNFPVAHSRVACRAWHFLPTLITWPTSPSRSPVSMNKIMGSCTIRCTGPCDFELHAPATSTIDWPSTPSLVISSLSSLPCLTDLNSTFPTTVTMGSKAYISSQACGDVYHFLDSVIGEERRTETFCWGLSPHDSALSIPTRCRYHFRADPLKMLYQDSQDR